MTAFVIIGTVAGLIWLAAFIRVFGLLGGSVAVVVLGVCAGWFLFHVDLGPISATSDRIALGGLCGLYVLYRCRGLAEPKPWAAEDLVMCAFVGCLLVSIVLRPSDSPETNPLSLWVFYFLSPAVLYWVARQSKLTPRGIAGMMACLIVMGVYLGITAIAEKQGWRGLIFPRYIADPAYEEFLGRGRGPLLNPIGNGLFLTASFVACVLWWPKLSFQGRAAVSTAMLIITAGAVCTMTRSVWLGAAVAGTIPLLIHLSRRQKVGAVVLGLLLAGVMLAAKGANLGEFKRDKNVSAHDMAQSAKLRPLLASLAWRIVLDEPFFGCGFQRYREVSHEYINARFTDLPIEKARGYVQHNVFLALLVETGLIGFGLYVALLAMWAWRAWELATNWQANRWIRSQGLLFLGFLAAFVVNGMFHDVGIIIMVNQLLMLLAGVTTGLAHQHAPARASQAVAEQRQPQRAAYAN